MRHLWPVVERLLPHRTQRLLVIYGTFRFSVQTVWPFPSYWNIWHIQTLAVVSQTPVPHVSLFGQFHSTYHFCIFCSLSSLLLWAWGWQRATEPSGSSCLIKERASLWPSDRVSRHVRDTAACFLRRGANTERRSDWSPLKGPHECKQTEHCRLDPLNEGSCLI